MSTISRKLILVVLVAMLQLTSFAENITSFIIFKKYSRAYDGKEIIGTWSPDPGNINLTFVKNGGNSPTFKYAENNASYMRLAEKNQIKVEAENGYTIVKIVLKFYNDKTSFKENEYKLNVGTYNTKDFTWIGNSNKVLFTSTKVSDAANRIRVQALEVYYTSTESMPPKEQVFTHIRDLEQLSDGENVALRLNNARIISINNDKVYLKDSTGILAIENKEITWMKNMQVSGVLKGKYFSTTIVPTISIDNKISEEEWSVSTSLEKDIPQEILSTEVADNVYKYVRLNEVTLSKVGVLDLFDAGITQPAIGAFFNIEGYIIPDKKGIDNTHYIICPIERSGLEFILKDRIDNIISSANNVRVKLYRTLHANIWNTICFPFSLSQLQIASVLGNVRIRALDKVENNTFYFKDVEEIQGGKAYLLKSSITIIDPIFDNVDLGANLEKQIIDGYGFIGTYNPYSIAADGTQLFLNNGNLKKPNASGNLMPGMRAYFVIPSSVEAKNYYIDDISTSIIPQFLDDKNNKIYRLDGSLVNVEYSKLPKGVYIINKKKIVIM